MTVRPAVLIVQRHLAPLTAFLESQWDVYRLWEGPPVEARDHVEALVVGGESPLDMELVGDLPRLKLIACFTSGYDGVDVAACRARGLEVTHAPGVNHEDVADHALGLILAARRRIVDGDRTLREGGWVEGSRLITPSLKGHRLGIVGLGAIGEAAARRAEAFGMSVRWWGPRAKAAPWPRAETLIDLARESDILVVAARADDGNRGLIAREVIEALGPDGLLVNVARGQLVDEDALIAALRDGRLGQAALDVFEQEPVDPARFEGVPNLVLTPHTGGATREAVQGMLALLVQNLTEVLADRPARTPAPN